MEHFRISNFEVFDRAVYGLYQFFLPEVNSDL
jgi:hypothetical protein